MIPRGGTSTEQAAAHQRIAQALRSQGDLPGALEALRNGARLLPESREIQLLLGELESARGNILAARAALEVAFRASRTDMEALEVVTSVERVPSMLEVYGKRIIVVGGGAQVGQVDVSHLQHG